MGELDGKICVITGAGSGMGRAAAEVFVREGAKVLVADVTGAEEETAGSLGDSAVAFRVDVTQEDQVEAMFAAALDAFGRVDASLHSAGVAGAEPLTEVSRAEYDRIMDIDLRGVLLCCKYAIRSMLPTGGAIVNISSTGGLNAGPVPVSVYSAAKAGVIAVTKSAAAEYGEQGIRANCICPGFVETAMSGGPGAAERHPLVVQGSALKRGGQPEEVGELASFLSSDRSGFITGAVIPIDGGVTAKLA
jgi:NAD(P)-dependent dehydrogenase (short-subunit alcohol dehydrogenase family)